MQKQIDANVILRYLMHDDDEKYIVSKSFMNKNSIVSAPVIAEVVYVLKGVYKISKEEIVESLIALSKEIAFENARVVIEALKNYEILNIDFVDCYLLARRKILNEEIITFDSKLKKELDKI